MTALVKGRVKPAKESFSRRHDAICVDLYRQWEEISLWALNENPRLKKDNWNTETFKWNTATLESPIVRPGRGSRLSKTIGFMDMFVEGVMLHCLGGSRASDACIIFEVKPEITSLGEVLRQVHRYRDNVAAYCGSFAAPQTIMMAVVSASNEYADILKSHDIVFIDTAWLKKTEPVA